MTKYYQGLLTLLAYPARFWQAGAMELRREQFERIKDCLPRQRGNGRIGHCVLRNARLYALEHGGKWRGLPKGFGPWHPLYTRLNRGSKKGGIDRGFTRRPEAQILAVKLAGVRLDRTRLKGHPDGTGARKKRAAIPWQEPGRLEQPRFLWGPRLIAGL